jgi:hypothetical protein
MKKVQLESTSKIVELVIDGKPIPARIWEGATEGGIRCHAFITRIAVANNDDSSEFDRDLKECAAPSVEVAMFPSRLIV